MKIIATAALLIALFELWGTILPTDASILHKAIDEDEEIDDDVLSTQQLMDSNALSNGIGGKGEQQDIPPSKQGSQPRDLQALPANDFCNGAEEIRFNGSIPRSTVGAGHDVAIAANCNGVSHTGPGVWFRVTGNGQRLTANACGIDFDAIVSIYSGTCPNLVCVQATDDSCGSVAWNSVAGRRYYVHVHGILGASGAFDLSVDRSQVPSPPTPPRSPSLPSPSVPMGRDFCSQAEPITLTGGTLTRTTVGASSDRAIAARCKGLEHEGPGVWFRIDGDGTRFTAETCSSTTKFDTVISVFSGNCPSLVCVEANNDHRGVCGTSGSSTHSSVSWNTIQGRRYYIHVHGFDGKSGVFNLDVNAAAAPSPPTGPPPTPPGPSPTPPGSAPVPMAPDFCNQAEVLSLTSTSPSGVPYTAVTRSTVGATSDRGIAPICNGVRHVGPGVWFRIDGDGTRFSFSTCLPATMFDTVISVYSGNCPSLVCVAANDNYGTACSDLGGSSSGSLLRWNSVAGRRYYIHVHGSNGSSGQFQLIGVSSSPVPAPVPSGPSFPSRPSYPSSPSRPSYPSSPSGPSYPSFPSGPSFPSFPTGPSYPSFPSGPSFPSFPSGPSFPSFPSGPSGYGCGACNIYYNECPTACSGCC